MTVLLSFKIAFFFSPEILTCRRFIYFAKIFVPKQTKIKQTLPESGVKTKCDTLVYFVTKNNRRTRLFPGFCSMRKQ